MKLFNFRKKRSKNVKREEAIVVTDGISGINECYNTLKDNILCICEEKKVKVIQVESSHAGEGKTTLSCNLAVSLSFNKKKVLVIDLDFRKPRVNRLFHVSNEIGIVDYIFEKTNLEDIVKKSEYEYVDIISRGSSIYNPSLLLTSDRFKAMIDSLRNEYDFIVLDCPPILQLSDYIHISKVSDGVLFVVGYGQTKKAQVREASQLLKKNNINVIGSVMTFVDKRDPYSSYYGKYRYYYGNYYDRADND